MIFSRDIEKIVEKYIFQGKNKKRVIVIYGPRQVGKTTLVKKILANHPDQAQYYNCDYLETQELFAYKNAVQFGKLIKGLRLLVLDEAQRIENIGLVLKILVDEHPEVQVLATGSSSFDLSNKINEPLTGRKIELKLYPLAVSEVFARLNELEKKSQLEGWLRFGSYPVAILSGTKDTEVFLKELTSSYLFKDILAFQQLKKPELLTKLLRLLAFQVGSEVSYHELATQLGADQTVIQRYLDLLEKAFVVFRLPALSRNLRKEVSKTRKVYFYDLGIRNALIQNFNTLDMRDDIGALWENFCLIERLKQLEYFEQTANCYFWRTYDKKEIDYIEEKDGQFKAFEFKWNPKKQIRVPSDFMTAYPKAEFSVVTRDNYEEFVYIESM